MSSTLMVFRPAWVQKLHVLHDQLAGVLLSEDGEPLGGLLTDAVGSVLLGDANEWCNR
jgi:hypothetical protein